MKEDPGELLKNYYSDIFNNHAQTKIFIDNKANWLLGISAVFLGLSFTFIEKRLDFSSLGYYLIFISSLVAFLLSLLILELPSLFIPVKHVDKSYMFLTSSRRVNAEDYSKKLGSIQTNEQLAEQYAYEICNMTARYINVKKRLLRWPTYILFFGLLFGSLFVLTF